MKYAAISRKAHAILHKYGSSDDFRIVRGGGVRMVGGVEIVQAETVHSVTGFTRRPKAHEVDGERIIATDLLGNFTNEVEIKSGDLMEIRGERYTVTDARPILQTSTVVSYRPILRRIAVNV